MNTNIVEMSTMKRRATYLASFLSICLASSTVSAGEEENALIAKVTAAYGGDLLLNLSNYRIEDRFIAPAGGQSHSPNLTEIGRSSQVLLVDTKSNKAVYDTWGEGRQGGFQGSTVSDGEKAHTINYQAKSYGEANNADYHVFAGGTMRTSDTALVYELNKAKEEAKISEDEMFMSRPHHTLTMPFPSSPELKLFIDAETFLVSKMLRVNPQLGNLDYVFTNHKSNKGVTSATGINFSIAGVPNLISTKHEFSFDLDVAESEFKLPDGLSKEGDRIDDSEMVVNKISDRVYHVGQNGGYSLFADTAMGVVSAGGYPALDNRYKRFQSESENYKPLAYQVVTHHHSDHIGGLGEAVALGARLVTVADNVDTIKSGVNPAPKSRDFYTVGTRTTFGEGRNRVEVYEVSTIHAASFLVTYVPADKIVFIADHMGSPFANATPVAGQGTVDMLKALDSLNIDIKKIATAHNARIFSMQDMRNSVAAYLPSSCTAKRPVCT